MLHEILTSTKTLQHEAKRCNNVACNICGLPLHVARNNFKKCAKFMQHRATCCNMVAKLRNKVATVWPGIYM